jgi:hypothetical protein
VYYHERRGKLIAYLGGHCAVCGTTDDLQFDHIDPTQKSFDNMSLSNPLVVAELAKCQLLCAPHHREKTARENSGWTHGSTHAWMNKGCRCEICAPAMRAWRDKRNAKRRATRAAGGRGPYDKGPLVCGTLRAYRKGCKCDLCRAANAADTAARKRSSLNRQKQSA